MANQPHIFKHRDVVRLVKAARAAGVDVKAVTVDPRSGALTVDAGLTARGLEVDSVTGALRVLVGRPDEPAVKSEGESK